MDSDHGLRSQSALSFRGVWLAEIQTMRDKQFAVMDRNDDGKIDSRELAEFHRGMGPKDRGMERGRHGGRHGMHGKHHGRHGERHGRHGGEGMHGRDGHKMMQGEPKQY